MNTGKGKTPPTVNSKTFLLTMYCRKIKARRKFLGTLTVKLFIFQFKHLTLIYNRIFFVYSFRHFITFVCNLSFCQSEDCIYHTPICTKHKPIKTILFDHVITNSGGNFNNKTDTLWPTQDGVCMFSYYCFMLLL